MEIIVRKAKVSDVNNIIDLAVNVSHSSIPSTRTVDQKLVEQFRRNDLSALATLIDLPHMGIYIAEDSRGMFLGHILGYTGDVESVTGEKQGWIFDLAVKEAFRGRGVAKKLVNHFTEFVKSVGLKYIGLLVTSDNKEAVGLYEGLGFFEERKRMAKKLD